MSTLSDLRPVYAVGIGLHRYTFPSETPYVQIGLTAIREALDDARLGWTDIQSAYVGTSSIGMAAGRVMLKHLGSTGLQVTQVENASASGSSAFRMACLDVAAGLSDVALAIGVDKHGSGQRAAGKDGLSRLSPSTAIPAVRYALLADRYRRDFGVARETLAQVAVKNHGNASRNPYAQFQKLRTLEDVLGGNRIVGDLTTLQCCPRGDGAAAVIVMSEGGLKTHGITGRMARVLSSVSTSEGPGTPDRPSVVEVVRHSTEQALADAGVKPGDLDLVELHDAFSVEELIYLEEMGVCKAGQAGDHLLAGASSIGGEVAVNASGGLLGMGHPLGPTGVGQVCDIVRQLRGEAGPRQQPDAKLGLAHMIGLGTVAIAHVLQKV